MQNDFIEELRRKAKKAAEDEHMKKIKEEYPWLTKEVVEDKYFENTMRKMFNPNEREER